ncbi:hypothetical protein [Ruegeria sp. HKCCD8929]|uniref:hypothetical protein n=1 Tax=Ruegeria sp. HKCCD8929 TaxID=2683006 RepID=UPI001489C080|nr:hypothetical protein [Ruegeria sp. HKCCD8929]
MTGQKGKAIWYWFFAVGLFVAGFLIFAEPAHAHGDMASHSVAEFSEPDPENAEKGHPGHCHGGTFCNGVAMFVVAPMPLEPFVAKYRQTIPNGILSLLAILVFDPPPPRFLI